ncbi:hypothetical protein ACWET9_48770 [Streptomyces sp. NPDC004059]|uniref:hypothetical protein n=1 Tax=Streptomyces sp. NPDC051917 TaxID=3154754 RepID=UPI003452F37D
MSETAIDTSGMSAECALAQRPGYKDLHRSCRQTEDVPLPHGGGILLMSKCTCAHHPYNQPKNAPSGQQPQAV